MMFIRLSLTLLHSISGLISGVMLQFIMTLYILQLQLLLLLFLLHSTLSKEATDVASNKHNKYPSAITATTIAKLPSLIDFNSNIVTLEV